MTRNEFIADTASRVFVSIRKEYAHSGEENAIPICCHVATSDARELAEMLERLDCAPWHHDKAHP